jgi:hypothetical protein
MALQAAKKWISCFDGTAPQIVQDAMQKFKVIDISFATANNFIVGIYEIADEDWPLVNSISLWFADSFTMETYPLVSADDHARIWDQLGLLGE